MEKYNAYWMEEPFEPVADRSGVPTYKDFLSPRRLAQECQIPIAGGNFLVGLEQALECLRHESYDILQPDASWCGGILTAAKIAHLCEAYRIPIVLHGTMGLRLDGWVQATAAIGAEWIELALITPPLLPQEQWSPAMKVLRNKQLYAIDDGRIQVPDRPGLGLDLIEEALDEYRVKERA
jgi:D-galactarolactone cycloisomerase